MAMPDPIPPPPPTMPASPRAIAAEIEPIVERAVARILDHLVPKFDAIATRVAELEQKSAARHRTVIRRITQIERRLSDHEARLRALETTRIVIRGLEAVVARQRRRPKKGKRRAPRQA